MVTKSQDRALPEWVVQLQRKGEKQELQRATVSSFFYHILHFIERCHRNDLSING